MRTFPFVLSVSFFWAIISPALRGLPNEITSLTIDPIDHQELNQWGLDFPSTGGLDEATAPLTARFVRRFFERMQPTAVRFVMVGTYSYNEKQNRVTSELAEADLGRRLAIASEAGIKHYVLSFSSPPKSMKTYYVDSAHWEFNPNSLREEYNKAYIEYAIDMIGFIKDRGFDPPDAISIAVTPDTIVNTTRWAYRVYNANGCPYTPEHWSKLQILARQDLNNKGLSNIKLIGPETFTVTGAERFLHCSDNALGMLDGISFDLGSDRDWGSGDCPLLSGLIDSNVKREKGVWIFRSGVGATENELSRLLRVFGNLMRDLLVFKADHWFWHFESGAQEVESIIQGSEIPMTPVCQALEELWRTMPAGSRIHKITGDGIEPDAGFRSPIAAFALKRNSRVLFAVANNGAFPRTFQAKGLIAANMQVAVFGSKTTRITEAVTPDEAPRFTIPARSVGIITFETATR